MCLSSPQRATAPGLQNKVQERHHCLHQQWLHPLGDLLFPLFSQKQLQSAKSHWEACITSGKLSVLTFQASPQGRTTGERLQRKIGLLK